MSDIDRDDKNIKGTNISSPIVPFTTDDTYPTHEAKYGKGGFRTVSKISDLNLIPEARREEGMLVYVIDDPSKVNTYQYINGEWAKSKIGSGINKVNTVQERNELNPEEGDLVYVVENSAVYVYQGSTIGWKNITVDEETQGIPIYDLAKVTALGDKVPDDYIIIPSASELDLHGSRTGEPDDGTYVNILFKAIRSLQSEVAKLRNSFKYGMYSYTGKQTAMSAVMNDWDDTQEIEPLWAVEEKDLSPIEDATLDINDLHTLTPKENVIVSPDTLEIEGTAKWKDSENDNGFLNATDPKLFLYMTTSEMNFKINLRNLDDPNTDILIDFSQLSVPRSASQKYNILLVVSRATRDEDDDNSNYTGYNFIWISIANYATGVTTNEGYWGSDNRLTDSPRYLEDNEELESNRYYIESAEFTNLNLYKFSAYSKFQDFNNTVTPNKPSDEDYKYRVAHITIRSVINRAELDEIEKQLPENELIYNEETNGLLIKTKNGIRQISGGGSSSSDGMEKSEIIEWLAENGIIVTEDGIENIRISNLADITFIHQETGQAFRFEVDSEGQLKGTKLADETLEDRMNAVDWDPDKVPSDADPKSKIRGFVGSLGYKELAATDEKKDLGLYSDRIKIGSIYAPVAGQQTFGCSHAFIELENTSDRDFPLEGCYLHFATRTTKGVEEYSLALTGIIPAGGTYLIRGKQYSDFNQANTFIKVTSYDQEWYAKYKIDNNNYEKRLIDFSLNDENSWCITYGLPGKDIDPLSTFSYSMPLISKNNDTETQSKALYCYNSRYIDAVSIGSHITATNGTAWFDSGQAKFKIGGGNNYDCIYKNTFELDPAKQAYQALNTYDSSRSRNEKAQDYQYLLLNRDIISFPKTEDTFAVNKYTPKASYENKNVCTDKSDLDLEKPNMVTVSFGRNIHTTRCFNWVSCGLFDEYVWVRKKGTEEWAKFESYKLMPSAPEFNVLTNYAVNEKVSYNNEIYKFKSEHEPGDWNPEQVEKILIEIDNPGETGITKVKFGTFNNRTINDENYRIQNVIYSRITGTFPGSGIKYTSHKCILNIIPNAHTTGYPEEYEYKVGRADINGNPDPNHVSDIQTFKLYPTTYTPRIFQITDQQGFHWIEYQVWAAAAKELNNTINEACSGNDHIIPILINTGDMTQNGTRYNEWLDYYNAGKCLFDHLEQMNVVGNNDLCGPDPEKLGTGDDQGKSNAFYFHVFYCYEIDPTIIPIISNSEATHYVPSLYYFGNEMNQDAGVDAYRFLMINSEITEETCKSWYKQLISITENDVTKIFPVNVYTGWSISRDNYEFIYDISFETIYSLIYKMISSFSDKSEENKEHLIAVCHEMPFTVITNSNLKCTVVGEETCQNIDRSLSGTSLVGSHLNRLNRFDKKSNYWFSRLLEYFGIKLCIGGHKHTYACTNPLREFYYYEDNKNSLTDGPMEMNSTLQNDSAIFSTTVGIDSESSTETVYSINSDSNSITINTSKFPLMINEIEGITKTIDYFFPYYGINSFEITTYDQDQESTITINYPGVVYFMCQATGYKLKSNKELPSPSQKFSYVIPLTDVTGSSDSPNENQQRPMFAEIRFGEENNLYTIYLYRIENIMNGIALFSQLSYSTSPASYKYLKGNDCDVPTPLPEGYNDDVEYKKEYNIYGKWVTDKTALITIN